MGPWRRPGLFTFGTKRSDGTFGTELRRRAGSTPLSVTRINIAVTRSFKTRNPGSAGRGRRVNHAICRPNAVFAEHEPLSHLSGYPPRSTTGTFSSIGCHINRCRAAKLTVTQHDQKRQYRCSQQRRTEIDRLGWWIASPGGDMGPKVYFRSHHNSALPSLWVRSRYERHYKRGFVSRQRNLERTVFGSQGSVLYFIVS